MSQTPPSPQSAPHTHTTSPEPLLRQIPRHLLASVQFVSCHHPCDDFYPAGALCLTSTQWSTRIHQVPAGNTTLRTPSHHLLSASRYAARKARTAAAARRHSSPFLRPTANVGLR